MKILILTAGLFLISCANKNDNSTPQDSSKEAWSLSEPQIINQRGKIYLTNVQHQTKQALELTDSLLFDLKEESQNLKFTTLSRCYDDQQAELKETKSFDFQQKISIQKLMPKQSFHPKYIINKKNLNCTFKFKVQKPNGSSHNFRLYSQSVSMIQQDEKDQIQIAGPKQDKLKVLKASDLHQNNFIIPDIKVQNIQLVCQSFTLDYLAQKNLLNPFYGFNVESLENKTYPRELCRIIAEKNGDYVLSKPFQIEFYKLNVSFKAQHLNEKYSHKTNSTKVFKLMIHNPTGFEMNYTLQFPSKIMINKMGTNYSENFHIEYTDSKNIQKMNPKKFNIHIPPQSQQQFVVITNLSRVCYGKISFGLGTSVITDLNADVYFPKASLSLQSSQHKEFIYNEAFVNSKILATQVTNKHIQHPAIKSSDAFSNKTLIDYTPHTTNKCLSAPPKVHQPVIRAPRF